MPYYVYRVLPMAQVRKLNEFDAYKAAAAHAKTLRANPETALPGTIRIIFADNELHAEDLLCQVREQPPLGEDG